MSTQNHGTNVGAPLPHEEKLTNCPLCGGTGWTLAFPPNVSRCLQCGALFREPRPTQDVIAASYDSGHTYSQWQKQGVSWDELWNRRLACVERLRARGRLLDIGIGDASFLRCAAAAGYEAEGTELSETGAQYARRLRLNVRVGQFVDLPFANESFDIVTMWHVLEHVPDPQLVVQKIFRLLRPNGIFVLAVPNEAHALIRNRLRPSHFPEPFKSLVWGGEIHLTHFTPHSIKAFLRREGFEILRFQVDDFYPNRGILDRIKFNIQQGMGRLIGWHSAAAMQVVCLKSPG